MGATGCHWSHLDLAIGWRRRPSPVTRTVICTDCTGDEAGAKVGNSCWQPQPPEGREFVIGPAIMKLVLARAILAVALMTSSAGAGSYSFIGQGGASCGTWIAVRRERAASGFEQWILGFLSGVGAEGNVVGSQTNPLNGIDADAVWAWMDNYCRDHPLGQIIEAAEAFVVEHPH